MTKYRVTKSLLASLLPNALVLALPPINFIPPSSAQAGQPAPRNQTKFRRTRITAADIARLPRGKNFVVQISADTQNRAGTYSGSTTVNTSILNSTNKNNSSAVGTVLRRRPVLLRRELMCSPVARVGG